MPRQVAAKTADSGRKTTTRAGIDKNKLQILLNRYKSGELQSLAPLTFLLGTQGRPYNLRDHYMFEPLFRLKLPKRRLWKCSRQVGKSNNTCGDNMLRSILIPHYLSLFVTPLYSQSARLSTEYIQELAQSSAFRGAFLDRDCYKGVLRRTYRNGSRQQFSYAFNSVLRIRGFSGIHDLRIDEIQSFNVEYIPIIREVMSSVKEHGYETYSGTPLSMENPIQEFWEKTSQAEWAIPCPACNFENITCLDDGHILKMIGKTTCVCAKCGKPLPCHRGYWLHRYSDRRATFEGYHVSQVTHPRHYLLPHKWRDLREKMDGGKVTFINEVLGESVNSATTMVTRDDMRAVGGPATNTLEAGMALAKSSPMVMMGIDWSGKGTDGTSTTAIVIAVQIPDLNQCRIAYIERLPLDLSETAEIDRIIHLFDLFKPHFLAHDVGGEGHVRESMLLQSGVPAARIIPYRYDSAPHKQVIRFEPATSPGTRLYYKLDKARSIAVLCQSIKAGGTLLPEYESAKALLDDFLHITRESHTSPHGSSYFRVNRRPGKTDDVVNAANYACSCLWYAQRRYPLMAQSSDLSDADWSAMCADEEQ
jgi:hypothetical protein